MTIPTPIQRAPLTSCQVAGYRQAPGGWFDSHRDLYPENWDAIATAVKDAAGWRCEACYAPHGPSPHVLTVDHLNHTPADCSPTNLIALCQRCHLRRQALRPRPATREHAITRLQQRIALDTSQLQLDLPANP